jgi:hypothetical protein
MGISGCKGYRGRIWLFLFFGGEASERERDDRRIFGVRHAKGLVIAPPKNKN